MSLRESVEAAVAKAGPEALAVNQLEAAHSLGRTVGSVMLSAGPLAGQMFDAHTTLGALEEFKGRLEESNPLMQSAVKTPWQFYVAKGLIGGAMGLATWLLRKKHKDREATIVSVLGTATGLVPGMLNRASVARERKRAGG